MREFGTAHRASGLRGRDLNLGYHGRAVVVDASLRLHPGEVTSLVGPNGSGKSTLLRSLARLHKPSSGDIVFDDDSSALDLTSNDFARRVTLLAQRRPTPVGISVADMVAYGRHPHRRRWQGSTPADRDAIAWAMEVTGIESMAARGVDELSGGELQRVWLATCLAQDTDVLMLDEPTTYLDLRYQVEILDLVRDLAGEHGVAVGVVLHDLNQAADVSDHMVLIHEGVIRATGEPQSVLTSELLSEVYGLRVDVEIDPRTDRIRTHPVGKHSARATVA